MTSYAQYSRNQVTSEEAADALEQTIFDSDHLYQTYRDELSPLFQAAELRLGEMGLQKFKNLESILKTHIGRWYRLNKNLSEMALNFRTHYNHINVKLDSLKTEIEERDKIIRTQRKDFSNEKDHYENQLKVLESALANSFPINKTLKKYGSYVDDDDDDENKIIDDTQFQLKTIKKELKAQEHEYQKLKTENQRLNDNIKVLKSNSNDFQQTLMNLNNEIAKKEDEILKLRWLTQDLAAERNGLELKVQQQSKDPNFVSVTPQRQMEYDIDLSKYMDDDADDLSDDAAENGMLLLEMSDDADINPEVAKKLAEALEAVKKVTQFANDRDIQAKQLESQIDDKIKLSNGTINGYSNHSRKSITATSKPSTQELYENFEKLKKIEDSSPLQAHTLISQMGGFNGLTNDVSDGDDHYTAMLKRVEHHIENGTRCIELISKCANDVIDDEKSDELDINSGGKKQSKGSNGSQSSHLTKLRELQNHGASLITILNQIINELRGAFDYIHPDHKKVELLKHKMKELEITMPYIEAEQLAILTTLPSFLKQELNKLKRRPNRIRTTEEEEAMDEHEEKQRQQNFDNSLSRVEVLSISIKEKTDIIKNSLRSNLEKSQTDPKAFAQYLQQIDIACDQISEYTLSLDDEFHFAREYIHPSQAALISIVNEYNNLKIECEELNKLLSIKQGQINAYEEMKNTRPKRVIASAKGPPPGLGGNNDNNNHNVHQAHDESFQFDDIEKDFMQFATQFEEQKQQQMGRGDGNNNNNNNGDGAVDADHIVPKMATILSKFKHKTSIIQSKLKELGENGNMNGNRYNQYDYNNIVQTNYDLNNQLNDMIHLIDDMNNNLIQAKQIMGPDAKYISRLERRYVQIMGLYQMKYAEVEHKSDLLYRSDEYINNLKEDVSDLDYRLGAVMSSAVSNVETRMKAFNEMGIKIQTFQKVMKLIDDTYTNIQQACQDIQESVDKDLYDIIGNTFSDKQFQDTAGMIGNVAHACDYILKAFDDIGQEMDGVGQFVHSDREMCEQLQCELIAMYENQEKQQQEMEVQLTNMGNMNNMNNMVNMVNNMGEKKERERDLDSMPSKRHPNILPGSSHDDIVVGSRRKSILDFSEAFSEENKRRSKKFDNKLQQEDRRRSKHSQRRRSSVSNIPLGLLPPVVDDIDPLSKSDIGGHTMKESMNDEDRVYLKSLAKSLAVVNVARLKETPANSPLNSPTNQPPSPASVGDNNNNDKKNNNDDDGFPLLDDAVDDVDIHRNGVGIKLNLNRNGGSNKRSSSKQEIELLQKQISDKSQLIQDLQTNLRELSGNRRRELKHFQHQLEEMKDRCRDWYEQLMKRVREMESAYQDKIGQELRAKQDELQQELNEERRRMRDEFENKLQQNVVSASTEANPHEIDELSREIARLNEELEKFKGKYFDSEQQKIELADQLDEIKEEKFKLEEKLEDLAGKLVLAEEMRDVLASNNNNQNNNNTEQGIVDDERINNINNNSSDRTTSEWNELVQKLREEKENQEAQYEEEFREFERMANEKVVQLEEYYVQQLQMKEVHVQQLQAQLQQQILVKQHQQQQENNNNVLQQQQQQNIQLNEENNKIKKEMENNKEIIIKLNTEINKLNTEINKLTYQQQHDREQLNGLKKKNESNESKISAYNASFIELAEKLKQLNDDTKSLRRDKDKTKKKCEKLEKIRKKLKNEIKSLNENIENITAVTKELVKVKQESKIQNELYEKDKIKYQQEINKLNRDLQQYAKKKIESINRYNVEMNNLRTNIKTLQKRINQTELENDKLRETDSQSVLGSAANWVPSNWWNTKK